MKKKIAVGLLILAGAALFYFSRRQLQQLPYLRGSSQNQNQGSQEQNNEKTRSETMVHLLRQGNLNLVIPTIALGEQTEGQILRRVDTGTGQTIFFGTLTSFSAGELAIDYRDGTGTTHVVPQTSVFEVPQAGIQVERDVQYLQDLTYPQTGAVAFDAATSEAISVTVLQSK